MAYSFLLNKCLRLLSTNMKTKILITLCFAFLCVEVSAEGEQDVKRGMFPFMAFIYYPDETVVDATGSRFLRGAVLIRSNWLVTSAVGPSIIMGPNGYPQKTLLARAGAITIDSNVTLNEDEDEQEQEVIVIIRPYNHSATQWWHTDIALMKTLLVFNITSAVRPIVLMNKPEYAEKTCIILVFAKRDGNSTEEKNLMQVSVDLQTPSIKNCGHHYVEKTMTCAVDNEETKNTAIDSRFCEGNSGGPLICEGDVIGIQTYIDNDCKEPHLYQLLSAWELFISCGVDDKCLEETCSQTCSVTFKDPPYNQRSGTLPSTLSDTTDTNDEGEGEETPTTVVSEDQPTADQKADGTSVEQNTEEERRDYQSTGETTVETTTILSPTPTVTSTTAVEATSDIKWPKEVAQKGLKAAEQNEIDNAERKPTLEAQQQKAKTKRGRGSVGKTNVLNCSLAFGCLILASFI